MPSVSSRPPGRPSSRGGTARLLHADQFRLSEEVNAWVEELASAGLERRVAHRLTLISVILVALREMPSFLGDAASHVSVALSDLDTFEVVQVALIDHDLDAAWDSLAEVTDEPISSRCRALSRMCRRNGLQVVGS